MKKISENHNMNDIISSKKSLSNPDDLFDVLHTLDKHKITDYAIKQVINHNVPMLTFGKQGKIYKITLPYEGGEKYFLVAKKKKDSSDETYDLRKEFRMQQLVHSSVHHDHVKVPELFGYQELPNGEQFIVMEFIPGQTLYTLLLNKVVEKNKRGQTPAKDDKEADINILKIFGLETAKHMLSKIETTPYIYSKTKGMKLFSVQQSADIKRHLTEFLDDMHKKGIYHRDLGGSLRNIMICPDGMIYIIDFGKAVKKHMTKTEKEIYRETTEHGINEYVADEEILNIIDAYTDI